MATDLFFVSFRKTMEAKPRVADEAPVVGEQSTQHATRITLFVILFYGSRKLTGYSKLTQQSLVVILSSVVLNS